MAAPTQGCTQWRASLRIITGQGTPWECWTPGIHIIKEHMVSFGSFRWVVSLRDHEPGGFQEAVLCPWPRLPLASASSGLSTVLHTWTSRMQRLPVQGALFTAWRPLQGQCHPPRWTAHRFTECPVVTWVVLWTKGGTGDRVLPGQHCPGRASIRPGKGPSVQDPQQCGDKTTRPQRGGQRSAIALLHVKTAVTRVYSQCSLCYGEAWFSPKVSHFSFLVFT